MCASPVNCVCCFIITGVPAMVPGITVYDNTDYIIGINFTLILVWGEPFNNLDPIVSYTVSCSGDDTCPPIFTTTDSTTRSYTITNLTPMTSYTFSIVATNSIGSGEAGVVMITTPSGEATCVADTVTITATDTITIATTTASTTTIIIITTTSSTVSNTDTAATTTSSYVSMTTDTSKSIHMTTNTAIIYIY